MKFQAELNCLQEMLSLRNSNHDPPIDLYYREGSDDYTKVTLDEEQCLCDNYTASVIHPPFAYTPPSPVLATIEPLDILLIKDEYGMPIDTPPSPYLVVLGDKKIDLLLRDNLDALLTGDRKIDFNPCRDIEELERLLADDPVPFPKVFDEPLGNSDSMFRSIETSDLIFEELTTEIGLDDSIPTEIDDGYYDSDGDILYFEQLLIEDTSSDVSLALLHIESSLLVLPLLDFKQICLREMERFDSFFSLTQSCDMVWVIERHSYRFPHMPLPRQVTYSPKVVMYRYFHPHLTSGDRFDHGHRIKITVESS
nr:hypothetical protein [Tanacetum cinerariifolium]